MKNVCLAFLMGVFFFPCMASAQATKPAPKTKTAAKSTVVPAAVLTRGKEVYELNCLACHQADGGGVPRLNPPLIKTTYVLGAKPSLIEIVLKGSQGKVEIEGETFHNPMPAMPHLTDQQIADVLTYVRNSFGNKASAVSATEVKTVRAKLK